MGVRFAYLLSSIPKLLASTHEPPCQSGSFFFAQFELQHQDPSNKKCHSQEYILTPPEERGAKRLYLVVVWIRTKVHINKAGSMPRRAARRDVAWTEHTPNSDVGSATLKDCNFKLTWPFAYRTVVIS